MRCIKLGIIVGQLNTGNNQVVLFIGGMCAKNKTVNTKLLTFGSVKWMKNVYLLSTMGTCIDEGSTASKI